MEECQRQSEQRPQYYRNQHANGQLQKKSQETKDPKLRYLQKKASYNKDNIDVWCQKVKSAQNSHQVIRTKTGNLCVDNCL